MNFRTLLTAPNGSISVKLHKAPVNWNFCLHLQAIFSHQQLFFSAFFHSSFAPQQSSPHSSTGSSSVKSSCARWRGTRSEPVSSDVFRNEISKGRLHHIRCHGEIKTGKNRRAEETTRKVQIDFVFLLGVCSFSCPSRTPPLGGHRTRVWVWRGK